MYIQGPAEVRFAWVWLVEYAKLSRKMDSDLNISPKLSYGVLERDSVRLQKCYRNTCLCFVIKRFGIDYQLIRKGGSCARHPVSTHVHLCLCMYVCCVNTCSCAHAFIFVCMCILIYIYVLCIACTHAHIYNTHICVYMKEWIFCCLNNQMLLLNERMHT